MVKFIYPELTGNKDQGEKLEMAEYKYKAFISYRHIEPDMQAAEKLQKLLESYKPPKNIGKFSYFITK